MLILSKVLTLTYMALNLAIRNMILDELLKNDAWSVSEYFFYPKRTCCKDIETEISFPRDCLYSLDDHHLTEGHFPSLKPFIFIWNFR